MSKIQISFSDEVDNISYVKAMIYGRSGIGKTVLGSTAPNPLIVSAEDGLLSLRSSHVAVTHVSSLEDINAVYDFLQSGKHEYESVVLDSLSELAQVLLAEYKPKERDKRQAYGKMADEMLTIVRKFRKLPMHVFFIAKIARITDEYSGRTMFAAKFPGKMLDGEMNYQLDEVLAMKFHKHEGKDFRVLQTGPDIEYDAKDRSGNLNFLEKPDLTAIVNKCLLTPAEVPFDNSIGDD